MGTKRIEYTLITVPPSLAPLPTARVHPVIRPVPPGASVVKPGHGIVPKRTLPEAETVNGKKNDFQQKSETKAVKKGAGA
jgi:hypothetical protein